jgi:hypothetical protein
MAPGILTFAGTIAVAWLVFAANHAVKMKNEESYLSAYCWCLFGLAPIAFVCLAWALAEDQPMWAVRILLFIIGAIIGGIGFLAIGELVRPFPKPCKVAIKIGDTIPYRVTGYGDNGHVANEVVLVGLRNTGIKNIDECRLELCNMFPHDNNIRSLTILKDLSLASGDPETRFNIARLDKRSNVSASIVFLQYIETDSGRQEFPTVLDHSKYTLTLKLVAAGRRSCAKTCCLWLDEELRLHLTEPIQI